uniref:Uncharacterized protein n=1 Tax=Eutreptiella gymnastica TaxID=73025 RepID=A0A7S4LB79_9EUGL
MASPLIVNFSPELNTLWKSSVVVVPFEVSLCMQLNPIWRSSSITGPHATKLYVCSPGAASYVMVSQTLTWQLGSTVAAQHQLAIQIPNGAVHYCEGTKKKPDPGKIATREGGGATAAVAL